MRLEFQPGDRVYIGEGIWWTAAIASNLARQLATPFPAGDERCAGVE